MTLESSNMRIIFFHYVQVIGNVKFLRGHLTMEQQADLLECIAFNSQLRFQMISDVQDYSWFTQNEMLINDLVAKLINYISRILY